MIDPKADTCTPEFYEDRIKDSIRAGLIHQSVYHCSLDEWQRIQDYTRQVLDGHISKCETLLDVGCAYGSLIECLDDINPILYLGIDRSPDFIRIARALYPECTYSFRQHEMNGERLFSEKYDWAILREMTSHYRGKLKEIQKDKIVQSARQVADRVLILNYSSGYEHFILDGV